MNQSKLYTSTTELSKQSMYLWLGCFYWHLWTGSVCVETLHGGRCYHIHTV